VHSREFLKKIRVTIENISLILYCNEPFLYYFTYFAAPIVEKNRQSSEISVFYLYVIYNI